MHSASCAFVLNMSSSPPPLRKKYHTAILVVQTRRKHQINPSILTSADPVDHPLRTTSHARSISQLPSGVGLSTALHSSLKGSYRVQSANSIQVLFVSNRRRRASSGGASSLLHAPVHICSTIPGKSSSRSELTNRENVSGC